VPQLRQQLETELGPAYRIERELGGGMSRVFLAEEVALGRRVVVKVLAPDLAAGVSGDRFRREVQLAARLQHPHIVPLLTAGQSGDLLYYIMPFVEGESLRQRLARDGELPVADAVALTREIADALSHAHRQGIVHRDIKPENVLLSGHHAVVADFGIAKAIEDGQAGGRADRPTLTSVGFTIGTPAYMAPEQALADPTTDHRADLYSLGVVAYEMLAGGPPFRGVTSQELIAAHVAQPPEPLSARRPACPPGVVAAVMRCLEKRPADRPQTAGEFLRTLDDAATPAGGITVVTPPTPQTASFKQRLLGRAAAAAALGVALFGALSAAGVLGRRSLVAEGALAERERVIIADFDNRTADSTLGLAVTEAFRVDLTQSPLIRPLTPEQVGTVLKRMRRDSVGALSFELSREIAAREGIRAIVAGDVSAVGQGYVVAARMVETASGNVLAAFRESAAGPGEIIRAVDRVSKQLRGRIGESLRATRAAPPLEQVTTRSLEALRAYSQALQASRRGDRDHSIALLEEAIRLDTTFASAHRALGIGLGNLGQDPRRRMRALATAYRLRHRLTERERLFVEASYYGLLGDRRDREVAAYQQMLELNPDDASALNNLGLLYHYRGEPAKALPLYRKAHAAGPSSVGFVNIVEALYDVGDSTAGDSALRVWASTYPEDIGVPVFRAFIAGAGGRHDSAAAIIERVRAANLESRIVRVNAARLLTDLARIRGRLAESRRHAIAAVREEHPELSPGSVAEAVTAFERASDEILLLEQPAHGVERLRAVLEGGALQRLDPLDRPYLDAAYLYARAGRADLARQMLAARADALEVDSALGTLIPDRGEYSYRKIIEGTAAAADGRPADALSLLMESGDTSWQRPWALPDVGLVHDATNRPDSALVAYERYLSATSLYRSELDAGELARVLFRTAELHEARGDRDRAAERYGRFVELWRHADPELQPRVAEARRRLAALAAEPAGE
jgi:tetratricopeptide (TPR) repeat protein/tRNA A-37 threonylcarbamoyl transferase component Bud32